MACCLLLQGPRRASRGLAFEAFRGRGANDRGARAPWRCSSARRGFFGDKTTGGPPVVGHCSRGGQQRFSLGLKLLGPAAQSRQLLAGWCIRAGAAGCARGTSQDRAMDVGRPSMGRRRGPRAETLLKGGGERGAKRSSPRPSQTRLKVRVELGIETPWRDAKGPSSFGLACSEDRRIRKEPIGLTKRAVTTLELPGRRSATFGARWRGRNQPAAVFRACGRALILSDWRGCAIASMSSVVGAGTGWADVTHETH